MACSCAGEPRQRRSATARQHFDEFETIEKRLSLEDQVNRPFGSGRRRPSLANTNTKEPNDLDCELEAFSSTETSISRKLLFDVICELNKTWRRRCHRKERQLRQEFEQKMAAVKRRHQNSQPMTNVLQGAEVVRLRNSLRHLRKGQIT